MTQQTTLSPGWRQSPTWRLRHYFFSAERDAGSACGLATAKPLARCYGDTPELDTHEDNCRTCAELAPKIRARRIVNAQ